MPPNKIFHVWVNEKLHLFLLIILLAAISISNGVVGSGSVFMVGSLSGIPADITMASYAYAIGLVCGIPPVLALKQYFSSKVILIIVFGCLVIINIILGRTDQPLILVMASFVNGIFKIVGLLEILATMMPILMPKGERHKLYGVYYPVTLIMTQFTGIAFVWMAGTFNWQIGQLFLNVPLLVALLLVIFLVHPNPGNHVSLGRFDWFGLIFAITAMLLLNYVLTYGQVKDWYNSEEITAASAFGLIAVVLLIGRTLLVQKPFLDISVFKYPNVLFGLVVMFLLGIFAGAGNLQTAMINLVLRGDPVESTRLSLYFVPGFVGAGLIGYLYFTKYGDFKVVMIAVSILYTLSFIWLYFITTSQATSQDFYGPLILRGGAILLSYMAVGIYVSTGVPFLQFFSVVFYYLTIRAFLGPAIFGSFFSNFVYRRSVYDLDLLASKADSIDPYLHGATYRNLQTQASLLAIREGFGIVIVFGILLIIALVLSRVLRSGQIKPQTGFVVP